MENRRLILFLLFIICIASALLFSTRAGFKLYSGKNDIHVQLFQEPLDLIDHITVERGVSRVGLIKQNNRWVMTSPFSGQVDQTSVARLLDALEFAKIADKMAFSELQKRGLSLFEFGISPPEAILFLEGANQRMTLQIGHDTPQGNGFYLRCNDQEQIFVLPKSIKNSIPQNADSVRLRRLTEGNAKMAQAIEIHSPGRPFIQLMKKETGEWEIRQPSVISASRKTVTNLLNAIDSTPIESFLWPTVSNVLDVVQSESLLKSRRELFGLTPKQGIQLQITVGDRDKPISWIFGAPIPDHPNLNYLLLQNGEAIATVSNTLPTLLNVTPESFRDLRIFPNTPQINSFKIATSDLALTFSKTNGVWSIISPISDKADQLAVRDALQKLLQLEAVSIQEFSSSSEDESTPAYNRIELSSDSQKWIFSITPDDLSGRYLRISFYGSQTFFRVESTNVPNAVCQSSALLALRAKQLLELPEASIHRITAKSSTGVTIKAERSPAAQPWSLVLPNGGTSPIPEKSITSFLSLVSDLKPLRTEKFGITLNDLEKYGFRDPWYEITFDITSADAVRKSILLGNPVDQTNRFAMLRGKNIITVLGQPDVNQLLAPFNHTNELHQKSP